MSGGSEVRKGTPTPSPQNDRKEKVSFNNLPNKSISKIIIG